MKHKLAPGWTKRRSRELRELRNYVHDALDENLSHGIRLWAQREALQILGNPLGDGLLDFLESIARVPERDGDE